MTENRIVVKYHNRRMLLTVDLNALFDTLFDAYVDDLIVEFVEMNDQEKAASTDEVEGLRAVRERFHLLETGLPTGVRRRKDLEKAAVAVGRK
jgi:hypothetical protein